MNRVLFQFFIIYSLAPFEYVLINFMSRGNEIVVYIIYISVENQQSWHWWKQINLLNFSSCHVLNIVKV